jgi:hypothetical protein
MDERNLVRYGYAVAFTTSLNAWAATLSATSSVSGRGVSPVWRIAQVFRVTVKYRFMTENGKLANRPARTKSSRIWSMISFVRNSSAVDNYVTDISRSSPDELHSPHATSCRTSPLMHELQEPHTQRTI